MTSQSRGKAHACKVEDRSAAEGAADSVLRDDTNEEAREVERLLRRLEVDKERLPGAKGCLAHGSQAFSCDL